MPAGKASKKKKHLRAETHACPYDSEENVPDSIPVPFSSLMEEGMGMGGYDDNAAVITETTVMLAPATRASSSSFPGGGTNAALLGEERESFRGESVLLRAVLVALVLLFLVCTCAFVISASVLSAGSGSVGGDADAVGAFVSMKHFFMARNDSKRAPSNSSSSSADGGDGGGDDYDGDDDMQGWMAMQRLSDMYFNHTNKH